MIAVQAPGYFLPADHLSVIFHCGKVHWRTKDYYIKQSYRNRAVITDAGGEQVLVVPVSHPVWQIPLHQIKCVETKEWQKKQFKALKTAYRKSPFFEWAEPELEIFFAMNFENLIQLNLSTFELLCRWFGKKIEQVENLNEKDGIKSDAPTEHLPQYPYPQVFLDRCGFRPNLSALDLFFNCGREGNQWMENRAAQILALR